MYTYTLYGLTLATPFPCAALTPAASGTQPDLQVVEGEVPLHLAAPHAQEKNWEAAPGLYLLRSGKRAGRFLVENGQKITLQRGPAAQDDLLALALLDSVIVAALRQRGKLVLHANTAYTPGGAVAISGVSGAGKSTTLTALLQRGCSMLADDITVLQFDAQGRVEALPGVPQMNLLEDAAAGLDFDIRAYPRHQWRTGKALVPTHEQMHPSPAPLSALYLLEKADIDQIRLEKLTGTEKFIAAQSCIYGPMLPAEHPALFPLFSAFIEQTAVYRLTRPASRWSVDEVTDIILHTEN